LAEGKKDFTGSRKDQTRVSCERKNISPRGVRRTRVNGCTKKRRKEGEQKSKIAEWKRSDQKVLGRN